MLVPLFAELQRRRVFRALVAYGIAAFAVLQIVERVIHGLHWPDAVLSYVVVALAVGFPVVVSQRPKRPWSLRLTSPRRIARAAWCE